MARIPALEPPFTPDVEAQIATMVPAGMPPIGPFCFVARTARVELEPGAPRFVDVTTA
ncbi:hypothetical protein AB0K00_18175 [Dactylosporangium sp. NPDC049525]|uniref:hypothetical protein n=1 Tax=Dactylosporangium sp. NPDC049525 TaxID=3154730 RepID=UPI00343B024E